MKEQLSNTVQEILDNKFSALEGYIFLKELKDHLDTCIDAIKEKAFLEAKEYDKQEAYGYKVSITNGYTTYDYSSNPDYANLKAELKKLEDKLKTASKQGMALLNEETGEVYEPCPIKGGVSETFKLTKVK